MAFRRTSKRRGIGALLALAVMAGAAPSLADGLLARASEPILPQAPEQAGVFDDWRMVCEMPEAPNAQTCLLEQTVTAPGRDAVLLSFQIRHLDSGQKIGIVRVPLGILVSRGLTLQVDQRSIQRLAVRSCHASGCIVPLPMSGAIVRSFKRGLEARFGFASGDGTETVLTVSLIGFTKALAAFDALE